MIVKSLRFDQRLKSVTLVGTAALQQRGVRSKADKSDQANSSRADAQNLQVDSVRHDSQLLEQQTRIEQTLQAVWDQIEMLNQNRIQTLAELQHFSIELAVAVATHICHTKIDRGDFPFAEMIDGLIQQLGLDRPLTLFLHPADLKEVEGDFFKQHKADGITILPDASLGRGECRADNGQHGLISTIELQAQEIRQLLLEGIDDAQIERRKTGNANSAIRRFPDRRSAD